MADLTRIGRISLMVMQPRTTHSMSWADKESTQATYECQMNYEVAGDEELLCAYKNFSVQERPSVAIDSVVSTSSGIKVDVTSSISGISKYADDGVLPQIRYSYIMTDRPDGPNGSLISTNEIVTISGLVKGFYEISVSVFDGKFESPVKSYTIFHRFGPECQTCGPHH